MDTDGRISELEGGGLDAGLQLVYPGAAEKARGRYGRILRAFRERYGDLAGTELFSAPGRSEIGGNHTDHQHGRVLAAAVDIDAAAAAAATGRNEIRVFSEKYGEDVIPLDALEADPAGYGHGAALVRGTAAGFRRRGYAVGGFDAYVSSDVLPGSGLSSSAAFEVLMGEMMSELFNGGALSPVEIAKIGQYAENVYFGKPCGLMDQCASAVGGFCEIDFAKPDEPAVSRISCSPEKYGYALCLVDAGGSHADLTGEYAAIPAEMKSVAACFGREFLGEVPAEEFKKGLYGGLRGCASDRAIIRAMHFFGENERVERQAEALRSGNFEGFLALVRESGRSSMELLQNIYPSGDPGERSVSLALAVCGDILGGRGARRIHGGGFAGTVQAFVPLDMLGTFREKTDAVFGAGKCHVLSIRGAGCTRIKGDE